MANTNAVDFLNKTLSEPLTFGGIIKNIRLTEYDNMTQQKFADDVLHLSKTRLSDIENNRKLVSISKAIELARKLSQSKRFFVTVAMQDMLNKNNLEYSIKLEENNLRIS